jgi:hypothetical protein
LHFPSLVCPVRAHRSVSYAAGAPPPSTLGSIAPPPLSKRPRVRTRGEHPSPAFILPSITPEPAQLLTGVSCAAAGLFPPWSAFSGAPVPVLHPRSCWPCRLNVPDPFPKPLEPRRGCPLVSGEPSPWDRAAPPRSCPASGHWIPGVRPRSNDLGLIIADLISALRSRSDRSSHSPSPAPLPLGLAGQPALVR